MEQEPAAVRYHCLVGHEIPAHRLDDETEMATLDRGLELRLCREHGTAIAVTRIPAGAREKQP